MKSNWRADFSAMLAIFATIALTACAYATEGSKSNRTTAEQDLAATLIDLEEQSYEAWKSGDAVFWRTFLLDDFIGWDKSGRIDKIGAARAWSGANCLVGSYRLVDNQVSQLAPHAAILTHRTELDGTCGGKLLDPASYTATIYVRKGEQWKAAFRAQSQIVDPLKAAKPANSDVWAGGPTSDDSFTQTLLDREREVWSAWKNHDAKRIDTLLGEPIQFIDIFGNHISTRSQAIDAWSGEGCEVESFDLDGAKGTKLTPDFGILTVRATANGECFGQEIWPIWGTAFYVKQGDTWLWTSGINVLAGEN